MQEVFEKIIEKLEKRKQLQKNMITYERRQGTITEEYQARKAVDVLDGAIEMVRQVATEYNNGWIPCSERLPEESLNSVIGWDEYRKRCCLVQYYGGRWILDNDIDSVKIIAWMSLPDSFKPKGE